MMQTSVPSKPHVALITAGGAGMFCGSCLHDNTWARALQEAGYEVSLIPTYTPIRVDEENLSTSRVFFGGINVYLNSRWPWWRRVPGSWKRWLDRPAVIQWFTRWGISTQAEELGMLTVNMLQGESGPHRAAVEELATYLSHLQPEIVLFTNALLSGALRGLRSRCSARMVCILQGDDIFLEALTEPYKSQVLSLVRERAAEFDQFVVQSRYYRDFMADYLQLSPDRFSLLPLTIDVRKHTGRPKEALGNPPVIGYFARICQEKGLHLLVESCLHLKRRGIPFRLQVGGYLPSEQRLYWDAVCRAAVPLGEEFEYIGSPATHEEKVAFLSSLDVFSMSTVYREPKGLPVLEALANGVPVVLPAHGAFSELIESTSGGLLCSPGNSEALADALARMLSDSTFRKSCAEHGWSAVHSRHGFKAMADASERLFTSDTH